MAHLEGLLNGLLLIAVAAVGSRLHLSTRQGTILTWSLVVTAYGNIVAATLAAASAVRGLEPGGSVANTTVYLLFMVAVVAVIVATGLVAHGARGGGGAR
jgi:hypothetical protein